MRFDESGNLLILSILLILLILSKIRIIRIVANTIEIDRYEVP